MPDLLPTPPQPPPPPQQTPPLPSPRAGPPLSQALSTLELQVQERILKVEVDLIVEMVAEADRRQNLLLQRRCSKRQERHLEHDTLCMGPRGGDFSPQADGDDGDGQGGRFSGCGAEPREENFGFLHLKIVDFACRAMV